MPDQERNHQPPPRYGCAAYHIREVALLRPAALAWTGLLHMAHPTDVDLPLVMHQTVAGLMTVFQTATDDSHRGRVYGAVVVLDAAAMLAAAVAAGVLGEHLGIVPVIATQGVGYCVAGLLILILLPRDRLAAQPTTPAVPRSTDVRAG